MLAEKAADAQNHEEQIEGYKRYIGRLDNMYSEDTEYLRHRATEAESKLSSALTRIGDFEAKLEEAQDKIAEVEAENEHILATNMAADLAMALIEDCKATLRKSEIAEKEAQVQMFCLPPTVSCFTLGHIQ